MRTTDCSAVILITQWTELYEIWERSVNHYSSTSRLCISDKLLQFETIGKALIKCLR